ncbi:UDP-glucose 4-epimerase GalE [Paenibacillus lignilyticus]|uniref:UDP-glucose 4-epimerase n=1 Tax=Paenibacillus lignilyticus TaxID=1172615 RepID=A0ABS5CJR3_9BACL|nr:UDP-glucose 4-epimerase GalE [Paenibacillus lignilyticus]MBP3966103.1 UDP-glucose 4-epimerase GalE [Paenibacillus lignilyticus]
MSILLTGGAGFIGSHTCVELLQAGYDVIVVDNLSNSNPESLVRVQEITGKPLRFYKVDLLDSEGLSSLFAKHDIEAVIHFAGFKSVEDSVRKPLSYYHNNITGTLVLADIMHKFNVKKLVFSSSATVYGLPGYVPIQEDETLKATNPYGRTKQMIEIMLGDLTVADPAWSIVLLRYFNPTGAHPSGRIGEDPKGVPSNIMPYITQVAVGKLQTLSVFGSDYPTADGTGVRDYIHVVDIARGHLKALERALRTEGIAAYNLGTGMGYSVLELVHAFEKAAGCKVPYQLVDRRPGDVAVSYADPRKAERELDWKAEKDLEAMCADAWRWQSHNPGGYAS